MYRKFLLLILFEVVSARISIEILLDENNNATLSYSGTEERLVQDADINLFKIENETLHNGFESIYGTRPLKVYIKSPNPPFEDLFLKENLKPVSRVLTIESAKVKHISKNTIEVSSREFDNSSNNTIKVNTGITQSVENTLTTSWYDEKNRTINLKMPCEVNLWFVNKASKESVTYSTNWGKSEKMSSIETIGTTTGEEIELRPGESVTSSLSANAGTLEIEVTYKMVLQNDVIVVYGSNINGSNAWRYSIGPALDKFGIKNEITTIEKICVGFHSDVILKVHDKVNKTLFR